MSGLAVASTTTAPPSLRDESSFKPSLDSRGQTDRRRKRTQAPATSPPRMQQRRKAENGNSPPAPRVAAQHEQKEGPEGVAATQRPVEIEDRNRRHGLIRESCGSPHRRPTACARPNPSAPSPAPARRGGYPARRSGRRSGIAPDRAARSSGAT